MQHNLREFNLALTQIGDTPGYRGSYLRVFIELNRLENAVTGCCQAGQRALARNLGYCRETVCRAVVWLRHHGFIRTLQRSRKIGDAWRYLSLKVWTAKEPGQVTWLQRQLYEARARRWIAGQPLKPVPRFISCDMGTSPPSRPVFNPENLMSPATRKPPDGR
jgi:hypothetical protein